MPDVELLQMTEPQYTAGQYRPQLFFQETAMLQLPFMYFILQRLVWVLKQRIDFVEGRAVLVFRSYEIL